MRSSTHAVRRGESARKKARARRRGCAGSAFLRCVYRLDSPAISILPASLPAANTEITAPTDNYFDRYPGFFFHPVNMETKLFHPCRTTITRWPNTKARIAHMIRKCHSRAQWKPPIIQASQENCTGFHTAKPVSTESTPSPIAEV